jgi:lipoyl(octanoyl) transferase
MKPQVLFKDLGKNRSYKEIWDLQESLLQDNVSRKLELRNPKTIVALRNLKLKVKNETSYTDKGTVNHLLFLEHAPVYTLGKSGDINHVLLNDGERTEKGIEFFKINRGGDITFHGPEQLVGYPILDLEYFKTDLGWYLRSLEEVIILTLREYDLKGDRSEGETGVWLDPNVKGRARKICAIGIRCSRWITMHGFAFNVNTDLQYFNHIIPCGIRDKIVTSLEKELGYKVLMNEVKEKIKQNFAKVFDAEMMNNF